MKTLYSLPRMFVGNGSCRRTGEACSNNRLDITEPISQHSKAGEEFN